MIFRIRKAGAMGLLKVALLQYRASADKAANLKTARAMTLEALEKKARFILLPEIFNFRGDLSRPEIMSFAAEKIPGPSVLPFMALARQYKAAVLLGSIIEKTAGPRAYNTSVFIDPSGKIAAKYRKINLFDARIGDKMIKESDRFLAGKRPAAVKVGDFTAGLTVCYDLRFPMLYRNYSRKGAQLLTVPSCFTKKTGEAHWEALLRARAIENLAYVLAPNQTGTDDRGMQAYGHSLIVSPWGEVIAQGSAAKQEIIFADINTEEVHKARRTLPGIVKKT